MWCYYDLMNQICASFICANFDAFWRIWNKRVEPDIRLIEGFFLQGCFVNLLHLVPHYTIYWHAYFPKKIGCFQINLTRLYRNYGRKISFFQNYFCSNSCWHWKIEIMLGNSHGNFLWSCIWMVGFFFKALAIFWRVYSMKHN